MQRLDLASISAHWVPLMNFLQPSSTLGGRCGQPPTSIACSDALGPARVSLGPETISHPPFSCAVAQVPCFNVSVSEGNRPSSLSQTRFHLYRILKQYGRTLRHVYRCCKDPANPSPGTPKPSPRGPTLSIVVAALETSEMKKTNKNA